jgi:parvulin-like peptidyl-prolyl isomerase
LKKTDWRNIALIGLTILTVLLGILLATRSAGGGAATLVRINMDEVTDRDVVEILKQRVGDQVLMELISGALLRNYAEGKGVSATPSEIEQVLNFERFKLEIQGQDLEQVLASQGLTEKDIERQLSQMVLQVKLIVPEEEIKAEIGKLTHTGKFPFTVPPRYRIRELYFTTLADAKQARALAVKAETEEKAYQMALNGEEGKTPRLFAPGVSQDDPDKAKALKTLQPGQWSSPVPVPKVKGAYRLLQLVQYTPVEPPTLANRSILVGQQIIQSDQKYQVKLQQLEAEALTKVDVQFYPAGASYEKAYKRFKTAQKESVVVPGMEKEDDMMPPMPMNTGK